MDHVASQVAPRRSVLFLPASNPRAIEKARALASDTVILDLEDAVAPDAKPAARDAAVAAVQGGGWGRRELVVRVNGAETAWGADDLAALRRARPDAVLLPKVSSPAPIVAARSVLGDDGPALWGMIENCRAILELPRIADAGHGLAVLVAGTNDLALDMRCRPGPDRAPLLPALSQIVIAARAAGLSALDGVLNALDDDALLTAECDQGRALGFDGKTLIHPSQIAAANCAYAPTDAEVADAHRIADAFARPEHAAAGAIRLDGRMVERLHLAEARRTLALAEACDRP